MRLACFMNQYVFALSRGWDPPPGRKVGRLCFVPSQDSNLSPQHKACTFTGLEPVASAQKEEIIPCTFTGLVPVAWVQERSNPVGCWAGSHNHKPWGPVVPVTGTRCFVHPSCALAVRTFLGTS